VVDKHLCVNRAAVGNDIVPDHGDGVGTTGDCPPLRIPRESPVAARLARCVKMLAEDSPEPPLRAVPDALPKKDAVPAGCDIASSLGFPAISYQTDPSMWESRLELWRVRGSTNDMFYARMS
jgi:hypothetical protein